MLESVAEGIKHPPEFEFRQSVMEPTLMGVWAKKAVRKGRTYGPFMGEKKKCSEVPDDTYSWEIRGPKGVRLYSIDASEPTKANWMRYVKSARSYDEQNMIATQYKRNIYYRTLRAINAGEELMCWYKSKPAVNDGAENENSDSALNTSGESIESGKSDGCFPKSDGEPFDRQMPILEKIETAELDPSLLSSSMSAESEHRAKVPAHLDVLGHDELDDDKVAEPPLISPIYPSNSHHAASFASITAGVDLGGLGDDGGGGDLQIQEPDISSSDTTSQYLPTTEEFPESHPPADSTSVSHAKGAKKEASGKKSKSDLKRKLESRGGIPKKRTRVGQKIPKLAKTEATLLAKKAVVDAEADADGIVSAVIGPDCVSVLPDGTEMFGCQFCTKKCRFPNGLKLHLMLKHRIRKITVEGVNTRKWGKGLGPEDIKNRKKPKIKRPEENMNTNNANEQTPMKAEVKTKETSPSVVKKKSPGGSCKKGDFRCHLCKKKFMYETWRNKHLLIHEAKQNKEMFLCSDCPRRFLTEGDLTKHKLTHRSKQQGLSPREPGTDEHLETAEPSSHCASEAGVNLEAEPIEDNGSSISVAKSLSPSHSSEAGSSEAGLKGGDERHSAKRRNVTSRKGLLKKVASCKICGIEFVSSSNLHRHLRRRHGLDLAKKTSPRPSDSSDALKTEAVKDAKVVQDVRDAKDVKHVKEIVVGSKPGGQSVPVSKESLLNVPKVNIVHTKGHMKTMANVTRMIRKKHATAMLQNMLMERKIGGEESKGDQSKMRARLHAALRQGKHSSKKKQGFTRIEQVASLTAKQESGEVPAHICPWQNEVRPAPFIPKKIPVSKTEESKPEPMPNNVEILDLRVKKSNGDGTQKGAMPYLMGDPSQPLDLTCHSRPATQAPKYKATKKPPPAIPIKSEPKTFTRFNITPRMKSTGWKSTTLSNPLESLDHERATKFSVLDAAITCNVCELPFDSMKLLTQHVVAHAEDYPYKCEFCVKLFETTDMLASHRYELHRVGKMYCCSECQQEFAYLSNLKQHQADMHSDQMCSYTERGPEEIRPQNFTDPTKAIQTPPIMPQARERISLIAHEMSKVSPSKFGRFSSAAPQEPKPTVSRKHSQKKDVPRNPQRHHPFAHARQIGYLSTLPDTSQSSKNVSHYDMATNNRCTKCAKVFRSTADLHVHIMECAAAGMPKEVKAKTPVKSPPKVVEKKKQVAQETKEKNAKARKLKMQAARRSRNRAVQKSNESEESDAAGKRKRARPGLKMYNPLNHTRRRASANIDDVHACQGCGKQFHFINGLERHMKLCPNKDKLFKKSTNPNIAPKNMNHQCAYCARQFVYLRSLKKHISSCPKRPAHAPTNVTVPLVPTSTLQAPVLATTTTSVTASTTALPSQATAVTGTPATVTPPVPVAATVDKKDAIVQNETPLKPTASVADVSEQATPLKDVEAAGDDVASVETRVAQNGSPDKSGNDGSEAKGSGSPRRARKRRRRLDPYAKRKRSASPRGRQRQLEEGDEEEMEEEEEEEEGEDMEEDRVVYDDGEKKEVVEKIGEKEKEGESMKEEEGIGNEKEKGEEEEEKKDDKKEEEEKREKKNKNDEAKQEEGKIHDSVGDNDTVKVKSGEKLASANDSNTDSKCIVGDKPVLDDKATSQSDGTPNETEAGCRKKIEEDCQIDKEEENSCNELV